MSASGGKRLSGEYLGCLLMAVAGVLLVSASMDIVVLFLGLEFISLPTYLLLFLGSNTGQQARSAREPTLTYFLLSIVSSGSLL